MSRGNVFKLSGNLALGTSGQPSQASTDIEEIKNSLKLLKARQNQRRPDEGLDAGYPLGNYDQKAYPSNSVKQPQYNPKFQYDYESAAKNHLPNTQARTRNSQAYQPVQQTYSQSNNVQSYSQQSNYGPSSYNQGYSAPGNQRRSNLNTYNDEYPNQPSMNRQNTYASSKDMQINRAPQSFSQQDNYKKDSDLSRRQSEYRNKQDQYSNSRNVPQRGYNEDLNPPQRPAPMRQRQPPIPSEPKYKQEKLKPFPSTSNNPIQNMSLKEANKQNKVQIVEYSQAELILCREGCGRKFNPNSIQTHENICKKVFQKKRKQFNAQQHRIVANEQKKLMKKGAQVDRKLEAAKNNQKMSKWKADSLAFRAALKQQSGGKISKDEQEAFANMAQHGLVKCKYCGRSFNEKAAQKHIIFCQSQMKKNAMKTNKK